MTEEQAESPNKAPQGLNLDDLGAAAPKVELKGKKYPVRLANVLGLQEAAKAQKMGRRLLKLTTDLQEPDLEDEMEDQLLDQMRTVLDEFLELILKDMPEDVRNSLSEEQKMAVMAFFTEQAASQRASLLAISARTSRRSAATMGLDTSSKS